MISMKKSQLIATTVYLVAHCLLIPISASADTTPGNLESSTVDSTRNIAGQLLNSLGQKLKTALSTDGHLLQSVFVKKRHQLLQTLYQLNMVCKSRA